MFPVFTNRFSFFSFSTLFCCFYRTLATCVPLYTQDGHSAVNTGTQMKLFWFQKSHSRVSLNAKICCAKASFAVRVKAKN